MELRCVADKKQGDFLLSVDFSIPVEQTGIFGASGSGKSTLVSVIAGLQRPDRGEIFLDGDCLFSSSRRINVSPERRRIAVVFQQPSLFPHLDVKSNLLYGFSRCAAVHRRTDFAATVDVLKLEELLSREVGNLSGGERQRVALGRAVLANPRLLLMDEPLSAIDDGLRFQIIPYLKSVSEQFDIPYMFISHSLVEMRLMAGNVLVVGGGRAVQQIPVENLARLRMGNSPVGYINLLKLRNPRPVNGLHAYQWGNGELFLTAGVGGMESVFELSSKDIIIFKRHPEAISARNLLKCTVVGAFESGNRTGIELDCQGERLIAEVVQQAAIDLDLRAGADVYAAVKASAFRPLF